MTDLKIGDLVMINVKDSYYSKLKHNGQLGMVIKAHYDYHPYWAEIRHADGTFSYYVMRDLDAITQDR